MSVDDEIARLAENERKLTALEREGREGGMLETAVSDLNVYVDQFAFLEDGRLYHKESGVVLKGWFAAVKAKKPHWWPGCDPAGELAERCFGANPSLTAQGELLKSSNMAECQDIARRWGTTFGTLKPGTAPLPTDPDAKPAKPIIPPRANPWLPGQFNLTEQGRLVKALGIDKANQIARAAGSYVGALRPAKKTA